MDIQKKCLECINDCKQYDNVNIIYCGYVKKEKESTDDNRRNEQRVSK